MTVMAKSGPSVSEGPLCHGRGNNRGRIRVLLIDYLMAPGDGTAFARTGGEQMTERTPTDVTNLDIYGNEALPWSRARDQLAAPPDANNPGQDHISYLGTVRPDGRPHSAGIGELWLDGEIYFTSGPGTRKSRNLAENPACTISTRLKDIDLVLEGEASRVTDPAILERAAARYRDGGWPAEAGGDALTAPFSAPSAGPPPWYLYHFAVHTAFGVATAEPYGATRWRFDR